jgi:hypothetical protein
MDMVGLLASVKDKGDGHGKGGWVLRTEELPEPVEVGASRARWKGHRVLPTDEEISLAQPVCYLEACWSREGDQSGICRTQWRTWRVSQCMMTIWLSPWWCAYIHIFFIWQEQGCSPQHGYLKGFTMMEEYNDDLPDNVVPPAMKISGNKKVTNYAE